MERSIPNLATTFKIFRGPLLCCCFFVLYGIISTKTEIYKSIYDSTIFQKITSHTKEKDPTCGNRTAEVRLKCAHNGWFPKTADITPLRNMYVDDVHRVIYCGIAKVACSYFKMLMVKATGKLNESEEAKISVHDDRKLRSLRIYTLNTYNKTSAQYRLDTYKKFMVVRHPFDRLVSTFQDKFVEADYYPKAQAKVINETFPSDVEWERGNIPRVTFHQFLELIARRYNNGEFRNVHWNSYVESCHPCGIRYDKIVKLETIETDIEVIREWLQYSERKLIQKNESRNSSTSAKFEEVSNRFRFIKPDIIKALIDIYGRDFELFGYTWDTKEGARCSNSRLDGMACC